MSRTCNDWAWKLNLKPATLKFTLLALCDTADDILFECFPSIQYVSNATGLNKKTVQQNIGKLINMGYISDTGSRKGKLQRVRILKINPNKKCNDPEIDNVPENGVDNVPENGVDNVPENGLKNQSIEPVNEPFSNQQADHSAQIDIEDAIESTNPIDLARQIIDLYNDVKKTEGPNWTGVSEYTAARLGLVKKQIKFVERRTKSKDPDVILDWFERFLTSIAHEPFYSGRPRHQNDTGYKWKFDSIFREKNFVDAIERINEE